MRLIALTEQYFLNIKLYRFPAEDLCTSVIKREKLRTVTMPFMQIFEEPTDEVDFTYIWKFSNPATYPNAPSYQESFEVAEGQRV